MLTSQPTTDRAETRPLTHRDCLAAGRQQAAGRDNRALPWVQVRRHHKEGPYVLCGRVVELSGSGEEWFKVETCAGPMWAQGKSVRMCSGDGRCTCESATDRAGTSC
jgi:hypothetical protein